LAGPALDELDLDPDAFVQFDRWYRDATDAGLARPDAMALATATPGGTPSVRMVLFKGIQEGSIRFFTNYESRKGWELAANPRAAVAFYWSGLHRQVRVAGSVRRLSDQASARYFATRPRGAQLAAWASHQSEVLSGSDELLRRVEDLRAEFEGREVPLPPFWGGFALTPEEFEFWQGREDRLHDRFRYQRTADGWAIQRLGP
jgi:pyridoxamine 5'-phosphate oxidase